MNRLPTFRENIEAPIRRALAATERPSMHFTQQPDGSYEQDPPIVFQSYEERHDFAEDVASEIRMIACPLCGHINRDHRWTPPTDCLVKGCECKSQPHATWEEEAALVAEIDQIAEEVLA